MGNLLGTLVKCSVGTISGILRLTPFVLKEWLFGKRIPEYKVEEDAYPTEQFGAALVAMHDPESIQKCSFQDVYFHSKDGTRLHAVVDDGSRRVKGKRPIVFVHGFPEFWISWLDQIKHFAAQGHAVLALDMRGHGLSDKPTGSLDDSYHLFNCLVEDIRAAVQFATKNAGDKSEAAASPLLVGHDWGSSLCWIYASQVRTTRDKEIAGYISLAIPPPECFEANIGAKQLWASLYMFFFNMPWLPEVVMLANNAWLVAVMMNITKRVTLPTWMTNAYRANVLQEGAMTAQLNYYRTAIRPGAPKPDPADVLGKQKGSDGPARRLDLPVLIIRGKDDDALTGDVFVGLERYLSNARLLELDKCSHWITADCPNEVNDEIEKMLGLFVK